MKRMMRSGLGINATMVANEFIDRYMAGANGEYVKVYLYLLRHQSEALDIGAIADALNHTESDVRRALGYWGRLGVLSVEAGSAPGTQERSWTGRVPGTREKSWTGSVPGTAPGQPAGGSSGALFRMSSDGVSGAQTGQSSGEEPVVSPGQPSGGMPGEPGAQTRQPSVGMSGAPAGASPVGMPVVSPGQPSGGTSAELTGLPPGAGAAGASKEKQGTGEGRKFYTPEQVSRLADQEDFTQLLYISQKYMNKVFTPRECEVFAYLYDALGMAVEVLEYLVEYCVQNGHYSIRYLESVALNWHEKGIRSVDMAKDYTASFSKEGFAVMRAFGITDRRPGESEQKLINKWFKEFGFTRDIIVEACSRTLTAIHKPSFSYADKILTDWKKGGVRVLADVGKMDEKREREGRKGGRNTGPVKPGKNQFHNFEQRGTNYDAMVLERLKERLGEQQG